MDIIETHKNTKGKGLKQKYISTYMYFIAQNVLMNLIITMFMSMNTCNYAIYILKGYCESYGHRKSYSKTYMHKSQDIIHKTCNKRYHQTLLYKKDIFL